MAVTLSRDRRRTHSATSASHCASRPSTHESRMAPHLAARQHVPEAVAREEDAGPLAAAALLQRERARVRLARHGALRRRLEDEIP